LGIDVAVVDENQVETHVIGDLRNYIAKLAISGEWLKMEGSVCLRFIDAYGLTIFNQAQLPVLLSELEHTASLQTNPEIRSHIQEVCRLVSSAKGKVHMYIKFIGD
jgi:hypothetical protein